MTAASAESAGGYRTRASPLVLLAASWIAGGTLGLWLGHPRPWLAAAGLGAAVMLGFTCWRRYHGARVWGWLAVAALAAAWTALDQHELPADHLRRFVRPEAQLVEVTGVVDVPAHLSPPQHGQFARFTYEPPATLFTLRTQAILVDGRTLPACGGLLVKIKEADHTIPPGATVHLTGWLTAFTGPSNPGERDYRTLLAERDLDARLTLDGRNNCQVLAMPASRGLLARFHQFRQQASNLASAALRLGMRQEAPRLAFLDALLLGRWNPELEDFEQSFRTVGLTHILTIGGTHLAILLGLGWLALRLAAVPPRPTAIVLLAVLGLYLLILPAQVPILRAGVMAVLLIAGFGAGRLVRGIDLVALAAVLVLIWRPGDLASPGFQLSFGITAALIVFTRPVARRIWAPPPDETAHAFGARLAVWATEVLAVNLVGFAVATPLVAYHFQIISPLAILLSILAVPPITATLGLGFLKIVAGLVLPSAGLVLAGPLEWVTDTMTGLVGHASRWPGAAMLLPQAPSVPWVLAALGLALAAFTGWFAQRRAALAAAGLLCLGWLAVSVGGWTPAWPGRADDPAAAVLRLNMLAVGDGSCFLVRAGLDGPSPAGHSLMFDCGSKEFLEVGARSIVPALRRLGVERIDTLMISHPDLDHFCGVLDLVDQIPVERVLTPPQLLTDAQAHPRGAVAFLVAGLTARRVPLRTVERGWHENWGPAHARLLWPPGDLVTAHTNDISLVLALEAGGRRVLLTGDIQKEAMTRLLALPGAGSPGAGAEYRADVCDLPHHGAFVESSPRWLAAVGPSLVLQSAGPYRLAHDKWAPFLPPQRVQRLITYRLGMVELVVRRDGRMEWSSFKRAEEAGR